LEPVASTSVHAPLPHAGPLYGLDSQDRIARLIHNVLALIWRNILLIAAIFAVLVGGAIAYTMLQTPGYTAQASVQISDSAENVLGDDLGGQANSAASWDVDRYLNTQLDILKSRALAERVARALNLADSERFFRSIGMEGVPELSGEVRQQMAVGTLQGNMSTNLPRETRIAQINYESTDPALAADIANAYGEQFIQADLQRKYDSSAYARKFVGDQLEEARVRLESSERELNDYARSTGLIRVRSTGEDGESSGTTSVTADSLDQLNAAANAAQARRIAAEARWNAEQSQPLMASRNAQSNGAVQTLTARRAELQSQLRALKARYLDDYPPVVELQSQVDSLDAQIARIAGDARSTVRNEYVAALAEENRLRQQVAALRGETLAEQDRSVRYNTLAREADTNRSLYDGLLQRYRELNAASGISTSNLSIIDRAEVPSAPSSPNMTRNILLALILATAISAAILAIRNLLTDTIRVPEDMEDKLHIPLLGVIPAAIEESPDAELLDPKSPMSEAFNSLRGSLLYATPEGLPRILLVTSSQASEGKSTSSIAIGRGLARLGRKVIIIDADMRRPSLHKRLGLANEAGLSDLLTSTAPARGLVRPSDTEGLSVITAGPIPPSPTELVSSPGFAARLEELSKEFDCVIIDSPPVLGLADAPVIAALADAVVLVVEAGHSRRGMVRTTLRRLRMMDAHLLGGLLTKFDARQGMNRYSEYYGYEYYKYESAAD